jgi:general secretion pathway protein K
MKARAALPHQRGAALLLAMVILTLVTTLAAGMVWQQWRAIEVEAAERARAQAVWILNGALDWARLILREDARTPGTDHLGEPWAVPLAEARLSTFLAADRSNTSDDSGIEAFLSGSIEDAQSRYNLRNLLNSDGTIADDQVRVLQRLCATAGLPPGLAMTIASGLRDARPGGDAAAAPISPRTVAQLAWLGIDAATIERLRPWVELLPAPPGGRTKINLNTAPREVLAAVIEGMDLGSAQRLVQHRERNPFKKLEDVLEVVRQEQIDPRTMDVKSEFFIVRGRLRLGERVLEEESLVQRLPSRQVVSLRRERLNQHLGGR